MNTRLLTEATQGLTCAENQRGAGMKLLFTFQCSIFGTGKN